MDDFFSSKPSAEELQRRHREARRDRLTLSPGAGAGASAQPFGADPVSAMGDTLMVDGDSLDDIIRDNSDEIHRRRSLPLPYGGGADGQADGDRRLSMMDFTNEPEPYKDYRYGNLPSAGDDVMAAGFPSMSMAGQTSAFAQPGMLSLSDANDYSTLSPDLMGDMMDYDAIRTGPSLGVFASSGLESQFPGSGLDPAAADFPVVVKADVVLSATPALAPPLGLDDGDEDMMGVGQGFGGPDAAGTPQPPRPNLGLSPFPTAATGPSPFHSPLSTVHSLTPNASRPPTVAVTPASMTTPSPAAGPAREPKSEKNMYSRSGFDMIRALYYVASRPNPEVHLGPVDMSCAFVVCDVLQNDCPIVYVSDNFQNLTGYSRFDIVGKNCRFLQAPDGYVEAGSRREFVENNAILNLKTKIAEGKEVQQSLINYRKGGKPFLNFLTMIPIHWDDPGIRYIVGFQIDLVECPDVIAGQEMGGVQVNYTHSDIPQYIWTPPSAGAYGPGDGQTLGIDDVSTLLEQYTHGGGASDWHKQSWDKMLLENADDVVHVLSLKGNFLYVSPSCKKVLEYDNADLVGSPLSEICHPSDIVPVTRELKDTQVGRPVNVVFRIRRKRSGYTWFESYGSLFAEPGKGRKWLILVGRKRPVFALHRRDLEANGGIGDAELWTKLSTAGLFLFVSSNVRSLLDLQPDALEGTSIQDLMRKESRAEFGRAIEKARRGKIVTCKHEVQNRRGQVLQAQTVLYPGDTAEGRKPTFLLAQTKLLKASSRAIAPASQGNAKAGADGGVASPTSPIFKTDGLTPQKGLAAESPGPGTAATPTPAPEKTPAPGPQDEALEADENIFDELKTTRCTSWQYELRQMEKMNRVLAEELGQLLTNKKKRKRRKGVGNAPRDCANCHTRNTPEWRRGPSGKRDLCNSCGLRWAKQVSVSGREPLSASSEGTQRLTRTACCQTGRVSPRNSSRGGNDALSKKSNSPIHSSPLQRELPSEGGAWPEGAATAGAKGAEADDDNGTRSPLPPPSQPLLAGGSGRRGSAMGMTSIREEGEKEAS